MSPVFAMALCQLWPAGIRENPWSGLAQDAIRQSARQARVPLGRKPDCRKDEEMRLAATRGNCTDRVLGMDRSRSAAALEVCPPPR